MSRSSSVTPRVGAVLAGMLAATTVLTACGTTPTASNPPVATSTSPGSSTGVRSATTQDAGTAVTTIAGATVRVPSSKPSVLVFISISCADCSAAAKAVAQARNSVGDKATFLAVDLDPGVPAQDLNSFLAYVHAKTLPTMIDAKFALFTKYKVSALSTVIVIDPAGKVTYRAVNPTASAITTAVAQSS